MRHIVIGLIILLTVGLTIGYCVLVSRALRGTLRNQRLAAVVQTLHIPFTLLMASIRQSGQLLSLLFLSLTIWFLIEQGTKMWRERSATAGATSDKRSDPRLAAVALVFVGVAGSLSLAHVLGWS